jgi:hypothetical protein
MINLAQAARAEALRLARNQVRDRLKAQAAKLSYVTASEVTRLAKAELEEHRADLIDQALRRIYQYPC